MLRTNYLLKGIKQSWTCIKRVWHYIIIEGWYTIKSNDLRALSSLWSTHFFHWYYCTSHWSKKSTADIISSKTFQLTLGSSNATNNLTSKKQKVCSLCYWHVETRRRKGCKRYDLFYGGERDKSLWSGEIWWIWKRESLKRKGAVFCWCLIGEHPSVYFVCWIIWLPPNRLIPLWLDLTSTHLYLVSVLDRWESNRPSFFFFFFKKPTPIKYPGKRKYYN